MEAPKGRERQQAVHRVETEVMQEKFALEGQRGQGRPMLEKDCRSAVVHV